MTSCTVVFWKGLAFGGLIGVCLAVVVLAIVLAIAKDANRL